MKKRLMLGMLLAALLPGCGSLDASGGLEGGAVNGGGDFGATQGGVQDMSFARDLVMQGQVPPPEALLVEAMFSEHDLPIEGAPCSTLLCPRAAMGVAPNADGDQNAWLQVGLASTIDPETYERPSLSIVATVDVSGSMGWDYTGEGASPGAITRALLEHIAGQLGEQDRFAMVTYGSSVDTVQPWVSGGSPAIDQAIAALGSDGSTNMEAGLERAYQLASTAEGTEEVRVMLFTDVQPNVGATTATTFQSMAAQGAETGVGLTVFGAGLGLGAELMGAMSTLRGGNAFSLTSTEDLPSFMEDNWPWLASPIAYDLSLNVAPSDNLTPTQSFGFPGETAQLDVATVFLSKRKGALLLALEPEGALESASADLSLSYQTPEGEPVDLALSASYDGQPLDERDAFMPQKGIDKTVALALLVDAMHEAATDYSYNQHDAAIARLEAALERFAIDAAAIEDPDIDAELAFWPKLLELMKQGAPQGSLYGQQP